MVGRSSTRGSRWCRGRPRDLAASASPASWKRTSHLRCACPRACVRARQATVRPQADRNPAERSSGLACGLRRSRDHRGGSSCHPAHHPHRPRSLPADLRPARFLGCQPLQPLVHGCQPCDAAMQLLGSLRQRLRAARPGFVVMELFPRPRHRRDHVDDAFSASPSSSSWSSRSLSRPSISALRCTAALPYHPRRWIAGLPSLFGVTHQWTFTWSRRSIVDEMHTSWRRGAQRVAAVPRSPAPRLDRRAGQGRIGRGWQRGVVRVAAQELFEIGDAVLKPPAGAALTGSDTSP